MKVRFTRGQILIYYLASCIGLAPFILRNNRVYPPSFLRKIHPWVSLVLTSLWLSAILTHNRTRTAELTLANEFIFVIQIILLAGVVFSIQLSFAFKSSRIIEIINRLIVVKNQLENIGIRDDRKKNRKMFYAKIIVTNFTVLSIKVILCMPDDRYYHTVMSKILMWSGNILLTIYCHNAYLIFIETVNYIGELFQLLNNKLEEVLRPKFRFPGLRGPSCIKISRNEITADSDDVDSTSKNIEKIGELHNELCDLTESTIGVFAVLITVALLLHLTRLLPNSYSLYDHVFTDKITTFSIPIIQQTGAWMATAIMEILLIANACAFVSGMSNATKSVLHELWNKYHPEELRDEFLVLSVQLLHKPAIVSAFGFLNLDCSILNKISYMVLAYFITMVQLDTLKSKRGA